MHSCIYAIFNKKKCEICKNKTKTFDIPVFCDGDNYNINRYVCLVSCNVCLIKLIDKNHIVVFLNKSTNNAENFEGSEYEKNK